MRGAEKFCCDSSRLPYVSAWLSAWLSTLTSALLATSLSDIRFLFWNFPTFDLSPIYTTNN